MRVHLGGNWHSLTGFNPPEQSTWTPMERATAGLIREWLSDEPSFNFQTSGSTGDPKKVTFQRWQLEASASLTAKALNLRKGTTSLLCLDPAFIAGRMMIVRSLCVGMDLVVHQPLANPLHQLPTSIDFVALVPLQLTTLLAEQPEALDQIPTIIVGGAPVSPAAIAQLNGRKCKVFATYGMTETLSHIALQQLNSEGAQDSFHLLPGITASSTRDGCLVISAPHLGPSIVTRDIVEWITPNSFRVLGRADDIINSGGVKVIPPRVEAAVALVMNELGLTTRFFIAGQQDDRLGERVCLIIEGTPLPDAKANALQAALAESLGAYERPREIIYRRVFLETASQKVDRRATLAST